MEKTLERGISRGGLPSSIFSEIVYLMSTVEKEPVAPATIAKERVFKPIRVWARIKSLVTFFLPNGAPYNEVHDVLKMLLPKKIYEVAFVPMFDEMKENHIVFLRKYEKRWVMRILINTAFVFQSLVLVGKCWRDAGCGKLLAWLTAIWGIGKLF